MKQGETKIAKLGEAEIAYLDEGEGKPVFLVHGFASSKEVNWVGPGWFKVLTDAGYRVVALDNRGHGASSKFYDPSDYTLDRMAGDALALMDHLGLQKPHLMGYSMGARISSMLAIHNAERFDRIVLAGNGYGMIEGAGDWDPVRDALLADNLDQVSDARGRAFRMFADQTGSDRKALAACVSGVRQLVPEDGIRQVANPILVAIGTKDDVAGSAEDLVAILQNGLHLPIPNRDHMRAVGDKVYLNGVLEFFSQQ